MAQMTEYVDQLEALHNEAFRWAMACCQYDEPLAEDVLQIAYLKILDGSATFKEQSAFKTFLFGVIRMTAKSTLRTKRYRDLLLFNWKPEPKPEPQTPEDELEENRQAQQIRTALTQLSDRQREVAELVFYQDLTVEEAAGVMNIGVGSARTHYSRAKTALLTILGETDE